MTPDTPLRLFDSLTRSLVDFTPVHAGEARVYSCGPTVYNYPHIGNMRAYVFADTLGRTLTWRGYHLTHIINITDVGHLTDDADAGEDKLEKAAAEKAQKGEKAAIWDIARHYTEAYWRDVRRLNIRQPAHWTIATEHIEPMIAFAKGIADKHCYQLDSGLYFDVTTVPDYGRLARAKTDAAVNGGGESRIETVKGKRNPQDFAIWRTTPPGETRQMEWDSPWGRGAPGWHLECSVMAMQYLGQQFDIHTGGIDHREIHHPNEIAQNQALTCSSETGANIWMHNNFLVERKGKMSKSSGEFLTLQRLVDRGYHPIAYRLMCLQAHYRSELEFSFDNLDAALTRLKRLVMAVEQLREAGPPIVPSDPHPQIAQALDTFGRAMCDDLNTPLAITALEDVIGNKQLAPGERLGAVEAMDNVLGLELHALKRADLRVRPADATLDKTDIAAKLALRKQARADKDFARSDAIRDELASAGITVMDGDPLGWDWAPRRD